MVSGWALSALSTARAAQLDVPDDTFELADHFLDGVQVHDGAEYAFRRGASTTPVMTAQGLLSRLSLGWDLRRPAFVDGLQILAASHGPNGQQPNVLYWYFATDLFHHVAHGTHGTIPDAPRLLSSLWGSRSHPGRPTDFA